MSPRAACRLEALGFERVYDYAAGIADWKAAGLPVEGSEDTGVVVSAAVRTETPTATPSGSIGEVHTRVAAAGWDEAVVIDCDRVVVGRLRGSAWKRDPGTPVEVAMEPGPTTVRPDGSLDALLERMERRGTRLVVVSDAQGRLIGTVELDDARRLVSGERAEQTWQECEGCPGRSVGHERTT